VPPVRAFNLDPTIDQDAFGFVPGSYNIRDLFGNCPCQKTRASLDHSYVCTPPARSCGKFQADKAAAHNSDPSAGAQQRQYGLGIPIGT